MIDKFLSLFWVIYDFYFYFSLKEFLKDKKKIIICDIDNTIADTWPYLNKFHKKSLKNFYIDLPAIKPVIEYVLKDALDYDGIIFLSSRPIRSYKTTELWIRNNIKYDINNILIILTKIPFKKLGYLDFLKSNNILLKVYDDLSYNHENGDVLFYDNVINSIKDKKIKLVGYEKLKNIRENNIIKIRKL